MTGNHSYVVSFIVIAIETLMVVIAALQWNGIYYRSITKTSSTASQVGIYNVMQWFLSISISVLSLDIYNKYIWW